MTLSNPPRPAEGLHVLLGICALDSCGVEKRWTWWAVESCGNLSALGWYIRLAEFQWLRVLGKNSPFSNPRALRMPPFFTTQLLNFAEIHDTIPRLYMQPCYWPRRGGQYDLPCCKLWLAIQTRLLVSLSLFSIFIHSKKVNFLLRYVIC